MIATVFLGPSMPDNEARSILPEAVFRPPAAQGDLLAAVEQDGAEIVGLIDGTFHQNLSVWHNEVCYLLSCGTTVFGASSMGALRAAETERFGAVGIGSIFRWYRDRIVTGDDEVALVHGDKESGYKPMSVPLVNVRASFANAVTEGFLDTSTSERAIDIARSLFYADRQVQTILQLCQESNIAPPQLRGVERALTVDYVDIKRSDAREMLMAVRQILDGSMPRPEPVAFEFARSSVFETLYNLDRQVRADDTQITLQAIAEHVALHSTEFKSIRSAALNRDIVTYLGLLLGIHVTEADVAAERTEFLEERGLDSPAALDEWLRSNSLSERDLKDYLAEEAVTVRLRRWLIEVRGFDRGCRPLLNELRVRGEFPHWARAAADEAVIVAAYQDQPEYRNLVDENPAELAQKHAAYTNVQIKGNAKVWAEDAGFDSDRSLADALRRSAIYNAVRHRISQQIKLLESRPDLVQEFTLES